VSLEVDTIMRSQLFTYLEIVCQNALECTKAHIKGRDETEGKTRNSLGRKDIEEER